MKQEDLQRSLLMALGNHEELIADMGDGDVEEIYFDEEIKSYRGKEIGIWSMEFLIEIATGKVENAVLRKE